MAGSALHPHLAWRSRRHLCAAMVTVGLVLAACGTPLTPAKPIVPKDRTVTLAPEADGQLKCYNLNDYIEILVDHQGALTITDVTSPNLANRFAPRQTFEKPIDATKGALWLRVRLKSELAEKRTWWLSSGYWELAELYTPSKEGFAVSRAGASVPPPATIVHDPQLRFYNIKLDIPGGQQQMTLYLRLVGPIDRRGGLPIVAGLHKELHLPAGAPARWSLDLTPDANGQLREYSIYPYSEILPDPEGILSIKDVTSETVSQRFVFNQTLAKPFDAGTGVVWMRLRIHSNLAEDHDWWLFPRYWGSAALYVPGKDGFEVFRNGAFVPVAERAATEANLRLYFLKLPIPRGPQDMTVYLRLENDLYLGRDRNFNYGLFPNFKPNWQRPDRKNLLLQALTLGVLFALGLYHLILYLRIKERVYLLFSLAVLGRGILLAADNRMLLEFLWPKAAKWDFFFRLFQGPLWLVPFFLFFMAFLNTKSWAPRTHRLLQFSLIPLLLEPLMSWFRPIWYLPILNGQWLILSTLPIVVALYAMRKNLKEALIFLSANTLMLGSTISHTLNQSGVQVVLPYWSLLVGEIPSAVIFSIAVAEHIRKLQRERDHAKHEEAKAQIELKKRELEAAILTGELNKAQLEALKNQLRPHFLFNALNSISALMHENVPAAERTVELLGYLLRSTLQENGATERRLEDEVAFAERYLEIEKTRFPSRLSVVWEITPETLVALVPHFILQPIVENAVRRSIAPRSNPGTVWIGARRDANRLHLYVRDNGGGPTDKNVEEKSLGFDHTKARLKNLYGNEALLEAGKAREGGFEVTISLPFRVAEDGEAHRSVTPVFSLQ